MLFPGPAGNAVDLGTFNPSEKTGMLSVSLWAKWNGLSTQWQGLIGKRDSWADGQTMWQIEANQTTGALSFSRYNITGATAPVLNVGEWTHIAVTFDKTTARFYVNGARPAPERRHVLVRTQGRRRASDRLRQRRRRQRVQWGSG